MYKQHFENISYLYGDNVDVQIPNDVFSDLSKSIKNKNGSTNIQQSSFAYTYLVTIALLYKYAHFVDIDNATYIQNADIKELLGYNRTTKTIDKIIKKGGVLDELGLTATKKDYPIRFVNHPTEDINSIPLREFVTINDINADDVNYSMIKEIVKNRNYEVKEPTFLFEYKDENGSLYEYAKTHKVTLKEFMRFMFDENLDNIDFSMYCYFKSKCKGLKKDMKAIKLELITSELGIGKDAFYSHLNKLKENKFVEVIHKGWTMGAEESLEANEYYFKGV